MFKPAGANTESRGVAQSGSAPVLGTGCRRCESYRPDHLSGEVSANQRNLHAVISSTPDEQSRDYLVTARLQYRGKKSRINVLCACHTLPDAKAGLFRGAYAWSDPLRDEGMRKADASHHVPTGTYPKTPPHHGLYRLCRCAAKFIPAPLP